MKKKISIGATVAIVLLAVVITFQVTYVAAGSRYRQRLDEWEQSDFSGRYAKLVELDSVFHGLYAGEIDEDTILDTLLRAYVASSGDPYGQYLNADEYAELEREMQGNGVGIGVSVLYQAEENRILVLRAYDNAPAATAGIRHDDIIVGADDTDIDRDGYQAVVNAISGEVGSQVVIHVERDGEPMQFTVTRAAYEIRTVDSRLEEADGKKIGIVRIDSFEISTSDQFIAAVEALLSQGAQALVFDLRANPGGELNSIRAIVDYLVPDGEPIVHIRDYEGKKTTYSGEDGHEVDCPMAVLVNGNTASAAELFTASLRDYKKATVVGVKTYGKGCIQTLYPLSDGSNLRVTYGYYDPPYSDNYDGVGITPDITVVEDTVSEQGNSFFLRATDQDAPLQAAIAALTSDSAA